MKIGLLILLSILGFGAHAFPTDWEHDAEKLCTDPNLQVGGSVLAIMVPKPSPLYYAAMDLALADNYCPEGIECERHVEVEGSSIRSIGVARTMQHGPSSFTFPQVVAGNIRMIGNVRSIDLNPNAAFSFRAVYGGQVIAWGRVTHLCQRVVNGEPLSEMIIEYLKEPSQSPAYLRFRQGPVKP